jgi:putative DNA primase/helicase
MPKSRARTDSATLKTVAADLARRLGGYATPSGAMCRCPAHHDRQPSLSVRIGERALLFKCFAGCDTRDIMRALRRIDARALSAGPRGDVPACDGREARLRSRAREIWDQALPVAGTMAEAYLVARGLSQLSPALRFHRRTPLGSMGELTYRPALIAGLHEAGALVAVHRTFFASATGALDTGLVNPRRLLGRPRGAAVVLAPAGDTLGLAEGIETAMSAAVLLGIPVWATLGSERLAGIAVPDTVRRLVILPDNDRAGRTGAAKVMRAYAGPGRSVEIIWPPPCCNDWNDVLVRSETRAG